MARRILTQKEMQVARTAVDFCYIFGKRFPPRGPGRPTASANDDVTAVIGLEYE